MDAAATVTGAEAQAPLDFDALFAAFYRRLARLLFRVTGDAHRAEEIAAEAFWRLHCRPPETHDNIEGWLYRTGMRVDARLRVLDADDSWQPDVTAAHAGFGRRVGQAARHPRRRLWIVPAAAVATMLLIAMVPATRAAAQRLWRTLRVDRTEIVRIAPGSPAGTMTSFRLQLLGPPVASTRAADVTAAARLAGFRPQLIQSPSLGAPFSLSVSSELRGRTTVDREELLQALRRMGIPAAVPQSWDGAHLEVSQGPMVVAFWPNITLQQTSPLRVTVPADFDWQDYAVVALRIIGLNERDARRLSARPESVPTVMAARPEDEVVQVSLASGSGTILRDFGQPGTLQSRTLVWNTPTRHFVLTGNASCADCGHITDDFLIELANSVR